MAWLCKVQEYFLARGLSDGDGDSSDTVDMSPLHFSFFIAVAAAAAAGVLGQGGHAVHFSIWVVPTALQESPFWQHSLSFACTFGCEKWTE